jgi:hypothetical protein
MWTPPSWYSIPQECGNSGHKSSGFYAYLEQSQRYDFFASGPQGDLFGPPPRVSYAPDPEKVRQRMLAMLGQLRGVEECPWNKDRLGLNKVIFPQMANWLPEEEAAELRREFSAEVARLEAAGRGLCFP